MKAVKLVDTDEKLLHVCTVARLAQFVRKSLFVLASDTLLELVLVCVCTLDKLYFCRDVHSTTNTHVFALNSKAIISVTMWWRQLGS